MSTEPQPLSTIDDTQRAFMDGLTTSEALTTACLERIADPNGEGSVTFLETYREQALAAARAADLLRRSGIPQGPLAGIPVSVKDVFDIRNSRTMAGSKVLEDTLPAGSDSTVVTRLRSAGAIIVGRTNMSEFAYTGLGLNPHYGTPRSPFERDPGRVAGGSSSGSAVSVSDSMSVASIGTDTGGSGRIPAAFCGIVGYKPTQNLIPLDGVFPLAPSFDTVSPMARSVDDCRLLACVLSGQPFRRHARPVRSIRLGLATGLPMEDLEGDVQETFQAALERLRGEGVAIEPVSDVDWEKPARLLKEGMVTAVEGLVSQGSLFARRDEYDPRVAERLETGLEVPAHRYAGALREIHELRRTISSALMPYSAVILPTVPILPPLIDELRDREPFFAANAKVLRNTMIANILNLCAISLPIRLPVGMMLMGRPGCDQELFDIAEALEPLLSGSPVARV